MDFSNGFQARYGPDERPKQRFYMIALDEADAMDFFLSQFPAAENISIERLGEKKLEPKIFGELYTQASTLKNPVLVKQAMRKVDSYMGSKKNLRSFLEKQTTQSMSDLVKKIFGQIISDSY